MNRVMSSTILKTPLATVEAAPKAPVLIELCTAIIHATRAQHRLVYAIMLATCL